MPPKPLGLVTVDTGRPLTLGDIRRFLLLMEDQGASDTAAVMARTVPQPRGGQRRPDGGFPGGLGEVAVIAGYPRSGRGPIPPRPRPATG